MSIDGQVDNISGKWIYKIKYDSKKIHLDLIFKNMVNGWKGEHSLGWWLAIPSFQVNGYIIKNNKETEMSGRGYHDHNIYPLYVPFLTNGYHFGSLGGELLYVTWARIESNKNQSQLFSIINKENGNFCNINSTEISFKILDTLNDHGEIIPKTCLLVIDSETIQANLTFKTNAVHYIMIPGLKYWRYHIHVSGYIKSKYLYENIDNIEISELLRFS
jgi:hypothetical protein